MAAGLPAPSVHAQAPPLGDPTGRSGDRPGLLQEEPRPAPPPGQILPPLPPPPPREFQLLPRVRAFVREIRVVGSTVFTADELAKVTAPYVNRELTAEDLEALRVALTLLYVNAGYVNSGAVLPDQDVTEGVVTFQIIEGGLTDIAVEGTRWFRAGYLRRRFALAAGPPLNINALQRQLQLLLEDQRIRRLNAELKPGLKPGESVLNVRVEDRIPFRLWLDLNNHQPPSVGAERGIVGVEHQNLTGNGDILTLRYGRSDGLDPLLDFRYVLPLTAWDTTLALQYRRNSFAVVEEPFTDLDIESESDIYTIALRQPVYRTLNSQVALELIGERLSNETSLLGEPFTLSPGAHRGKSVVTAVRFAQEAVYRTQNQVIAGRSRFSVGVDALGATINTGDQPDGKFFAWLGQFQWVRRLGILDSQAIFRSDLQVAADPLLALEQIALGGRFSVRGYRENTLLRDSAFLASLEIRVPVIRGQRWADFVELAPFADYGRGWNRKGPTPDPQDLSSVGIGLRWAATITWPVPIRPQLEVYWGHALRNIKTQGGDLQDKGLHLQFVITVF
jgi:hemolysin activation/secretion protein